MKCLRLLWVALVIVPISAALGMSSTDIPSKFNIPWGNSAGPSYIRTIPQPSQIGIQNCAASLTDGFPPLTFIPQASGGCPPFGQDFNGILKQITQWNRWSSAGGPVIYDSGFSASIGGYPKGSILQSSVLIGMMWISFADNNTTNPDDPNTSANWVRLPGLYQPGTPIPSVSGAEPNAIAANGLTVGNASSNATGYQGPAGYWLFSVLWSKCPAASCPIYTSAGGASTRGASALADWNANKAIATIDMAGRTVVGLDGATNRLASAPVIAGSINANGSIIGENVHLLTIAQLPVVTPAGSIGGVITNGSITIGGANGQLVTGGGGGSEYGGGGFGHGGQSVSASQGTSTFSGTFSGTPFGGGSTFNIVQQGVVVQWFLSL